MKNLYHKVISHYLSYGYYLLYLPKKTIYLLTIL